MRNNANRICASFGLLRKLFFFIRLTDHTTVNYDTILQNSATLNIRTFYSSQYRYIPHASMNRAVLFYYKLRMALQAIKVGFTICCITDYATLTSVAPISLLQTYHLILKVAPDFTLQYSFSCKAGECRYAATSIHSFLLHPPSSRRCHSFVHYCLLVTDAIHRPHCHCP